MSERLLHCQNHRSYYFMNNSCIHTRDVCRTTANSSQRWGVSTSGGQRTCTIPRTQTLLGDERFHGCRTSAME